MLKKNKKIGPASENYVFYLQNWSELRWKSIDLPQKWCIFWSELQWKSIDLVLRSRSFRRYPNGDIFPGSEPG